MKIHVPQGTSAHAGFSSWTSSYLPASLGGYGSFIAAGLMALLFTTILVFLVEESPADEGSVSPTESSTPSLNSPVKRNRNRKNLNLRLVGLAEHQNALDADFGGNDAAYHSRYQISNGDEDDEDLKSPSPKFSKDFRTPQAHRSPPPPPIPQPRLAAFQALLRIPPLAAAQARGFPVDVKQPVQSEFRTPPASAPASISEVMAKAVNRRLLASPSPSPRTQVFTAVPPTTPVLSMAKLIMHRHDQYSKRPRRSPPPPPSPTSQPNAPSPSPTRGVFSTMQYTLKNAIPREGTVKSAASFSQEGEPPVSPMRSGFLSPTSASRLSLSMSINLTPESGNGTTRDTRSLPPAGLSPPPLRISKLSSQQVSALVSMVSSASPPIVPSPKSSPSFKRGPISARGNLSKALAQALDRQQSSFPIVFTPIEPDAPAEKKAEQAPRSSERVQENPKYVETTQKQVVAAKNEDDSFQLVKPKSKSKGRRMRRRPSTTLEEGGR